MRENQFYINHVSHLKQENDSPLQLITGECTLNFSFYIFASLPLTCPRLKISIALRELKIENISRSLKQKVAGNKYIL